MVGLLKQTSQEAEIQSAGSQASDVARFNPSTPPSAASADMLVERFQAFTSEVLMHSVHELVSR
jgi:hypothetical protein